MNKNILRRYITGALVLLVGYLIQTIVFPSWELASIKPNLLLIIIASYGFMRGPKQGMFMGFFAGLMVDTQFTNVIGLYALIFLLIGYATGLLRTYFLDVDFRIVIGIIAVDEFVYGLVVYAVRFMLRSDFQFLYYLSHIIIPELIYTLLISVVAYPLILLINKWLDTVEKRENEY